ncbi:hypothetical protein DFH06DRAFT_673733 [Mycena polygramma]|nr:hypothetical protein DFH06DRAFT_673733 [Mycena polygramma]
MCACALGSLSTHLRRATSHDCLGFPPFFCEAAIRRELCRVPELAVGWRPPRPTPTLLEGLALQTPCRKLPRHFSEGIHSILTAGARAVSAFPSFSWLRISRMRPISSNSIINKAICSLTWSCKFLLSSACSQSLPPGDWRRQLLLRFLASDRLLSPSYPPGSSEVYTGPKLCIMICNPANSSRRLLTD